MIACNRQAWQAGTDQAWLCVQQALLQGGWMSQRTPEHRIRVKVTDKPTVLVDLTVQGQSQSLDIPTQLAAKTCGLDQHFLLAVGPRQDLYREPPWPLLVLRSKCAFAPSRRLFRTASVWVAGPPAL